MKQDQVSIDVVTHHRSRWQDIHKILEQLCQDVKEVFFLFRFNNISFILIMELTTPFQNYVNAYANCHLEIHCKQENDKSKNSVWFIFFLFSILAALDFHTRWKHFNSYLRNSKQPLE